MCASLLLLLSISLLPQSSPYLPFLLVLMLHINNFCRPIPPLEFLLIGSLKIYLATSGIRALDLQTSIMPPETRSQDLKKLEDSFEVANKEQSARHTQVLTQLETYGQLLHATKMTQDNKIEELKELISGIAYQQSTLLQRIQTSALERSPMKNHQDLPPGGSTSNAGNPGEEGSHYYKVHKPRRDFPCFDGEDVHKWLYKCNQYFDMEEIKETEKVRLASFYLDGMALYWHQNFSKSVRGRVVTWEEYTEAVCGRFGGHQDPLEELMELRQTCSLETYIQEFDVLWNKADISERQAMVFFIGGLEIEIKNPVKMFDPQALRQAYNLTVFEGGR